MRQHLLAAGPQGALLACRLNLLLVQTRVTLDPTAEARAPRVGGTEVEEALRLLPTPRQLAVTRAR